MEGPIYLRGTRTQSFASDWYRTGRWPLTGKGKNKGISGFPSEMTNKGTDKRKGTSKKARARAEADSSSFHPSQKNWPETPVSLRNDKQIRSLEKVNLL